MQTQNEAARTSAPWLWAGISFAAWFASLWIALPLAGLVGSGPEAGLRWDLAAFLALNGALSMAAALGVGRLAFGRWLAVSRTDLVLPALGVVLAIAAELALHEWAWLTIGYYDWDFIGWTAGLSFSIVLVAVAWFGLSVAPRGAAAPPRIGLGLSATLVILIVLSNVPGLGDGVGPNSWPLAILVGLSGAYAIGAVITSLRGGSPG
jgi:hypothetical protein